MKKVYLFFSAITFVLAMNAQTFTDATNLLPNAYHSGNCTGVTDMNSDGLDDIIILDNSTDLKIAYQQTDGSFVVEDYGTVSNEGQWGMCIGDIDNDGHLDVMSGGYYDNVHIININGPGDYEQIEESWANIFMQACNFADINNDGWLDGFACHDDGESALLQNDGTGAMVDGSSLIDLNFSSTDDSGNYGTVWSDVDRDGDLDCMIAKCRQFINDPYDARRTNVLLINDGNNNYTNQAAERGLVNLQQSWTTDMADVDNDGDFDCLLTTHSNTLELYENDGNGYFTNVTAGTGLEVSGFFLQAKMADMDNDGYVDILHAGGSHRFFRNNGNMTFTLTSNTFNNSDTMHSFGIGDLNHDGHMDVYASYGDGYNDPDMANDDMIWMNNGNNNNFIVFELEGTTSNKGAVGALVEIHGPWGVQIREVRAGESYGITCTFDCHFGIGTANTVDYAIVHWPSGNAQVIDAPAINTWHQITEVTCTPPTAQISANGEIVMCPGESVTLNVDNAGGEYQWNNGSTTSSIVVTTSGVYSVNVWDALGCVGQSNTIEVIVEQDETPTVNVNGDLEFCEGYSVQLVASSGNAYLWSNGLTSQAISVTEPGDYSVTVTGGCEELTSASTSIVVFDSPDAPTAADMTITEAGTVNLTATGENLNWYDAADGTTAVGSGNDFTTPVLTETTSFWVAGSTMYGGAVGTGGKTDQDMVTEGAYHNNTGFYLMFDANEDIILESVKVFVQNDVANREIQLVQGNVVLATATVSATAGESTVALNFNVPAGTGYGLKSNTQNHGFWRDKDLSTGAPYAFPYDLDGLATITGTNVNNPDDQDNYYYYFYDWTVSTPAFACEGPREEVLVTLIGIDELQSVADLSVYPIPAQDHLTVSYSSSSHEVMTAMIYNAMGQVVQSQNVAIAVGKNQLDLQIDGLAQGVYQLDLVKGDAHSTVKFVKQ
jgi:ASPIC and UnbV/FG-GAP-like repeat/Ig-like domain CHU_C associated/Secretion system C-terminal sorting domain